VLTKQHQSLIFSFDYSNVYRYLVIQHLPFQIISENKHNVYLYIYMHTLSSYNIRHYYFYIIYDLISKIKSNHTLQLRCAIVSQRQKCRAH